MDKVFQARRLGEKLVPPEYKFMTSEQVEEVKLLENRISQQFFTFSLTCYS